MKNILFILLTVMLLVGCHGKRGITEVPKQENIPKPTWIDQRPQSAAYYIGIGSASKTSAGTDFAEAAKNNAFNDLVSEISVHVQAESFLHVLDVNYHFEEQFLSSITAESTEYIEGFERMGTWQDADNYYVYYRLSKEAHQRIKSEKKNAILSQAADWYKMGKEEQDGGSLVFAINNYLAALKTMEPYWNEPNQYLLDGTVVHLDNLVYASILDVSRSISVEHAESIELTASNQYEEYSTITVLSAGKPVYGIPVSYDYDRGKYVRKKDMQTNLQGQVDLPIREPNIENKDNILKIEIDILKVISKEYQSGMMAAVVNKLTPIQREIPINLRMPKVYLISIEKNLNIPMNGKILSDGIKNELLKKNFQIVTNQQDADYFLEIGANTSQIGISHGFHSCFLTFSIQVMEVESGNVIYQKTESSIKGLQLNYTEAGIQSYRNAEKKIKREIVPAILEGIF